MITEQDIQRVIKMSWEDIIKRRYDINMNEELLMSEMLNEDRPSSFNENKAIKVLSKFVSEDKAKEFAKEVGLLAKEMLKVRNEQYKQKLEFRKRYNDILDKYVETYDAIGEYEDRLNRDAERRMMEERESRAGF